MLPILFGAFHFGGIVSAVMIGAVCGFLAGKLMKVPDSESREILSWGFWVDWLARLCSESWA